MIDLLLNHLEEDLKEFDIETDNLRFVGFGYGAFIIHCYCIFLFSAGFITLKSCSCVRYILVVQISFAF
jgi:hypothetical protein